MWLRKGKSTKIYISLESDLYCEIVLLPRYDSYKSEI